MTSKKKTTKKINKTLVLLDAHAILHRAYHALPDFSSPSGEPTGALYGVVAILLKIVEEIKPDYLAACFDLPEPTFRKDAYDGYKAGRIKTDDALIQQIERSRDIFKAFGIRIFEHPGFEADDILGTIVEQCKDKNDLNIVIASGDMDTFQLITKKKVQVYMQRKGSEMVMYDEQGIKDKFGFGPLLTIDYKGIRGDTSDNIPGIPGVGETSALKLVATYGPIEKIYAAINKEGIEKVAEKTGVQKRFVQLVADHKEEAEFSKMLATIRRDAPVKFELPEKTWRDNLEVETIFTLFSELGFRTLANRVRSIFDVPEELSIDQTTSGVGDDEVLKASVLLWLLASDRTNASYDDIVDYGRLYFDTTDFKEITKKLEAKLKEEGTFSVYKNIEEPLLPVIKKLNATGVILDTKYLKNLSISLHKELSKLEKTIYRQADIEFNINSPKQMGEVLYDKLGLKPKNQKKTAGGQRSTRESELEKMINDHPIIKNILRYRELQKLLSTYIDNLPEMVSPDGRLRTTFIQTGAATGRMASQNPGLQNIPIKSEEGRAIRGAFMAASGYKLVAIDYSQIELRIAAIMSGDRNLVDIFRRGEDVHTGVAVRVFGVNAEEVTPEMRRKAKVINFGILYGMGVNALRANLGEEATRAEAQEFFNAYFSTFTRLAEYLEETREYARQHGYTETMFGRRRYFPGISSGVPFIRSAAERMAINAPIQGTEGDILRIAMIEIDKYITENKLDNDVKMLLQVHDELVFEIKEDRLNKIVPELVKIMGNVFAGKDTKGVPILTDVKVGDNWKDMRTYEK